LEALRKATLTRPLASISSIHAGGNVELFGVRGTAQEWDDLRTGRYATSQVAGALTGSSGWNGSVAWNRDYAGLVTIDGGTTGRLQAIDQAYLDTLGYLRPAAGGAVVVYAGRRSDGGRNYDVLAVTPPKGSEIDLWVDERTHLIARETESIGIAWTTTSLGDYHRVDGLNYPFSSTTQTSQGNTITLHLSSLQLNEDADGRTAVPARSVHDASMTAGASTTVPISIVNDHVYLKVALNGRGPYTFVLDSGGDYIITPEVARALQARSAGDLRMGGVGDATEGASFARVDSIAVGGAVARDQYMLVLPIGTGFGMAEGMPIDGMIGYQFLARFLTTIGYGNSTLTLSLAGSSPPVVPGAAALNFFFDGTTPRIPIEIDGISTTAQVDTGSRAGLSLSSPFVAANPSIAAYAKTPPVVAGFGVGGASFARLGRIPTLQIGPFDISNSVASFGVQSAGAFAEPYNPANLGGAIWRRFDLTLDYAHQRLVLARNAGFGAPFGYDRSGLFVIEQSGTLTVISSLAGSPGAVAGVAKGDAILTVNGAPAASISLAALRGLLSAPVGTIVRLGIRSPAGAQRTVAITLADYV
jgi:hypothetical protein